MKQQQVRVIDRDGKLLGWVSQNATVGVAKIAGGPCQYARRDGDYCWVRVGPSERDKTRDLVRARAALAQDFTRQSHAGSIDTDVRGELRDEG
jgi:hypothetical protein